MKIQMVFIPLDGHRSIPRRIADSIQSFHLRPWLPVVPASAILFLMQLYHLRHNQRRERSSLCQSAANKNATTKRTQAFRSPQIAKYQIHKTDSCASSSYTARATQLKPEKRTHRLGSHRIPIPSRPTRRKRVIQLQYLRYFSSSINYIQQSIVTPPPSVLIIVLGLRRLSRVQFRHRKSQNFE